MPEPSSDTSTHFGFETIPLSAKQERVDDVFRGVAARYDLMNDLMSGGLHRAWKSALITELGLPRGDRPFQLLDVAGGTGDISFRALKRGGTGVHATLLDINAAMLYEGQRRAEEQGFGAQLDIVQANAESLPFPDGHFDAVTIAFGIRNVPRIPAALAEFRRVLKPGGRFVCLEFSTVDVPLLDRIYDAYSFAVIPRLGGFVAGDAQPYQYLVESIRRFPLPEAFAGLMREAGFARVRHTLFTGGIAALHVGWRV